MALERACWLNIIFQSEVKCLDYANFLRTVTFSDGLHPADGGRLCPPPLLPGACARWQNQSSKRMKLSRRVDESLAFKIEVLCARENIYEYIYSHEQRSLGSFVASGKIAVPPSLWKWNLLLDALKWESVFFNLGFKNIWSPNFRNLYIIDMKMIYTDNLSWQVLWNHKIQRGVGGKGP